MKVTSRAAALLAAVLLAVAAAVALAGHASAATAFFVSPAGNNSDGTSWANAWTNTSGINWATVPSGSTVTIDGGASACGVSPYDFGSANNPGVNCGQRYSTLTIGQDNVTIQRSAEAGRNGTVVLDGGRDTPLPYCTQPTYSAATGAAQVIDLNAHTGVSINGLKRSGIVVRGGQEGVEMRSGSGNTLKNMEIFDNGFPTSHAFGFSSDGNGVEIGGNNTYAQLLVHDNGQDQFHSDSHGFSEAGSTFTADWFGAMRAHPSNAGEPFNDLQQTGSDPGCQHADGIQIFSPGSVMSGLTVDHSVFGPGVNQGLYPSDAGTGTLFNNVTVSNDLFLGSESHNIESDHTGVHGWNVHDSTLFAPQGGFEIPGDGANTMTNVIKQGGYVFTPGGSWTTSGNTWWTGDPLPGTSTNANPNFTSAPTGTLPSLSSLRSANLTPNSCASCHGSPVHSLAELMTYIDSQNGSGGATCTIAEATSPAVVTAQGSTTGVLTTASFSPPANSLLVVTANVGFHASPNTAAITISDSKGGAYGTGAFKSDGRFDASGVWYRYLTTAPGSMTVTFSDSNHAQAGNQLAVKVLTGTTASQATGGFVNYASPDNTSALMARPVTTTQTGSRVYLAAGGNNGTLTPNSATTTISAFVDNTDGESLGAGRSTSNTGTPGPVTLGWTNSKTGFFTYAAKEVLPAMTC